MDILPTPSSAILRDRGFSASPAASISSTPARNGVDRTGSRNGSNRSNGRRPEENRPLANLPKAFESMLKTTTETGDIGMFSIKPSRVPPHVNSPRRMGPYNENNFARQQQHQQQSFQPYGVPAVDDRRRLPSYARDTTSELISMYESPSQKSSRVFDDNTDYRSFSMTHTTGYTLSNHRSYTSLRSQPDGGALLQRPRSPFAYPTRLRRPGFRPSSPALTDGGAVDYRRRAEIDRQPYGPGHSTSSPSSLYAHKRVPPMLRTEGNRSTPSLLSHSSPPRRCSSPLATHNGYMSNDWARRVGPASVNTSPARSTFSLASTANLFANNLPASNTTTPGKAQTQTPMYYDYTEEFDESYNQAPGRELPPNFRMAETIPEDRPVNAGRPSLVDANARSLTPNLKNGVRISSSSASIHQAPAAGIQESDAHDSSYSGWPVRKQSSNMVPGTGHTSSESSWNGNKTPDLNEEVVEPSRKAESSFGPAAQESVARRQHVDQGSTTNAQPGQTKPTDRAQPNLQNSTLNIPIRQTPSSDCQIEQTGQEISATPQKPKKVKNASFSPASMSKEMADNPNRSSSLDFGLDLKKTRSSGFDSINTGITELTDLLYSMDIANESRRSDEGQNASVVPPERVAMNSPTIPEDIVKETEVSKRNPLIPLSTFNSQHNLAQADFPTFQPAQYRRPRPQHIEPGTIQKAASFKDLNFDIPRKSVSRSGSPMLAPKPISPARQLKLKNSVPQLMKALPPLPPHLLGLCDSPPELASNENTASNKSVTETDATPAQIIQHPPKVFLPNRTQGTGNSETLVDIQESTESLVTTKSPDPIDPLKEETSIASPPKLKLKIRTSTAVIQTPHDSRPWNSEENYPWSDQNPNIKLASIIKGDKVGGPKPARLKLKPSRTSNSYQDTVRITRDADSKTSTGVHLPNAKDLFTAPLAIDNLFHQFGKHLHSRRSSTTSSHPERESSLAANASSQIFQSTTGQVSRFEDGPSTLPTPQTGFVESCSDEHSHRSLRKKFSNLKARLSHPYLFRGGSISYDDVTLRGLKTANNSSNPPAIRSVPNLHASIGLSVEVEDTPLHVEHVKRRKFKEKLAKWFRGAKMAISARVKALGSSA